MARMLRKVAALAVLVIFILSIVPAVTAQPGKGKGPVKFVEAQEDTQVEEDTPKQKRKPVMLAAKEKFKQARERYLAAKEKYKEAKERFKEQKEKLQQMKARVKACVDDSEECQNLKKELRQGAKKHLLKTSDLILRSLEKLINRVKESKVLTAEEKEEALERISGLERKLAAKKEEIEALAEDVTAAELREKIKELKALWKKVRKEQRWIVTQLINNKLGNIVNKHEEYYNAMQMRITNLEEQGVNAEELKAIAERFKGAVDQLKESQEEADQAWREAKSNPDALELAKEKHRQVREKLKETKKILREFIVKYKELSREIAAERTTGEVEEGPEEAEEEAEAETTSQE